MVFIVNTVYDSLHATIKRYLRGIDARRWLSFNFKTARRDFNYTFYSNIMHPSASQVHLASSGGHG